MATELPQVKEEENKTMEQMTKPHVLVEQSYKKFQETFEKTKLPYDQETKELVYDIF